MHLPDLARRVTARLAANIAAVRADGNRDRGDSPVSTAVIVAIIAAGAIVIATAIIAVAQGWVNLIPTSTE